MGETAAAAWSAMRMLFEGAPATFALLAQAGGRSERLLRARAAREGWRAPGTAGGAVALERRLTALSDRLVDELEAASEAARADGVYDKARIDALSAMLRMVEKLGETTRGPERLREEQTRSDEDMAAALARIDARIVELAGELAARMGEDQSAGPPGGGD